MAIASNILGVDVGSVSVSIVEMTPDAEVVRSLYEFHHGNIEQALEDALGRFDLTGICGIAATASTPEMLRCNRRYDNRIALMKEAQARHGILGGILLVGGEQFGLIRFDREGDYQSFTANTSCAAGTGSFLDQQAGRLGISGIGELSRLAFENIDSIPKIATRCAVFAKTDLVHAQQEGYSLAQICDGLCLGLARNIVDTLFEGEEPTKEILFAGGVSRNEAVVKHIRNLIQCPVIVESAPYGACGAARHLLDELLLKDRIRIGSPRDVLIKKAHEKKWFYPPLTLRLSDYPDFEGINAYRFIAPEVPSDPPNPVEVDIYAPLSPGRTRVFVGIDIGSTSTKAVLTGEDGTVMAGFYTRTAGRPVDAVRALFSAVNDLGLRNQTDIDITGAGTTGSGRKFVGKIIGADLVLDEITAHARAAVEIDSSVDTIIEIGGQDAKFTTLKNGRVTFSVMNTVCAAGTGSFIEEQALKLGCPLADYAGKAENRSAPIASDRCTVFMERDINHYLSEGYSVEEVLASVLHSIVENYLTKVAVEKHIGGLVYFQGATAKNRALVAAFEHRLEKRIHVSKYCHLTGALGTALSLMDKGLGKTEFKGMDFFRHPIPIFSEVCELCTNHCKITVAEKGGEKIAFGFLCGRDYEGTGFVDNNRSGFHLLKARRKAFALPIPKPEPSGITIGLPAALHLFEDLPFWKYFFAELGITTLTSESFKDAVKTGKRMAGAEFCAPMAALHGHVDELLKKTDYVFLPFYLEKKTGETGRRQFCYYTQFSPAVVSSMMPENLGSRLLMPLGNYLYSSFHDKRELYGVLSSIMHGKIGFREVSQAYDNAREFMNRRCGELHKIYRENAGERDRFHVVLLGRPYTVLSPAMNKRIPDIFGKLGVKAFFQDMVPCEGIDFEPIMPMLDEIHWNYAATILKTAYVTALTPHAYPVFITSFKCTPDAFAADYFRKIMDAFDKPYLILQLDEHDSSVGYETRIEAAIRSFDNHFSEKNPPVAKRSPITVPSRIRQIDGKTLVIPNWDPITLKLTRAALRREGIDARILEKTNTDIRKSLSSNTGQCIPLNIIAREFIDYVKQNDLDPSRTVLWTANSSIACNLALFPYHIQQILADFGNGMEKAGIYSGTLSFMDISVKLPLNIYFSYMFGGFLRKMACRIRPYESEPGRTDSVLAESIEILSIAFGGKRSKEEALDEVIRMFEGIRIDSSLPRRPKVAIFGDLYVRDNEVMNRNLIRTIEENGGEAIVTPYSSYAKIIASPYLRKWFREGLYFNALSTKALMTGIYRMEKTYVRYFERILGRIEPAYNDSPQKILGEYDIRIENTGESIENILKIFYLIKHEPDISLFVQTSPAFCCPSLVTEAMAGKIERKTGIPVVSITYDGTGGRQNDAVIPYLKFPRKSLPARIREASNEGF